MAQRRTTRVIGAAISASAAVFAMTGVAGVAAASTTAQATTGSVSPSYTRHFGLVKDPHHAGHATVHGWGDLHWGTTYFYLTGAKLKDDAADGHSVKMIVKVAGVGTKVCYNSGGKGHTVKCPASGKSWTIGKIKGIAGSPHVQLCVYNMTSNFCTKSIAV